MKNSLKKSVLAAALLLAMASVFTACNKNEETNESDGTTQSKGNYLQVGSEKLEIDGAGYLRYGENYGGGYAFLFYLNFNTYEQLQIGVVMENTKMPLNQSITFILKENTDEKGAVYCFNESTFGWSVPKFESIAVTIKTELPEGDIFYVFTIDFIAQMLDGKTVKGHYKGTI